MHVSRVINLNLYNLDTCEFPSFENDAVFRSHVTTLSLSGSAMVSGRAEEKNRAREEMPRIVQPPVRPGIGEGLEDSRVRCRRTRRTISEAGREKKGGDISDGNPAGFNHRPTRRDRRGGSALPPPLGGGFEASPPRGCQGKKSGGVKRGGGLNRRGARATAGAMRIGLISNSQTRRNRYISRRLLSIGARLNPLAISTPAPGG